MDFESNDRRTTEYVLFALAFLGVMIALAGVVVSSLAAAVTGFLILLFSLLCFYAAEPNES